MTLKSAVLLLCIASVGCAGAKIKNVRTDLQKGSFSKSDLILVKKIGADNAVFTGDKSGDETRVSQEKQVIRDELAISIVNELKERGYNAELFAAGKEAKAIVIDGAVTKVEHGSGAARMFVGMGAGSSNMYFSVKVLKGATKALLGDFDVVATSGGRGGAFAVGSFVKAHLDDGAKKTADYIDTRLN